MQQLTIKENVIFWKFTSICAIKNQPQCVQWEGDQMSFGAARSTLIWKCRWKNSVRFYKELICRCDFLELGWVENEGLIEMHGLSNLDLHKFKQKNINFGEQTETRKLKHGKLRVYWMYHWKLKNHYNKWVIYFLTFNT